MQPLLFLSGNVTPKKIEAIHITSHQYPEPFLFLFHPNLLDKAEIRFYILVDMHGNL
jgi:hypothetical protein